MKAHRTDAISLIFGLFFLGAAATWLLSHFVHLTFAAVGWGAAFVLVAVGMIGLWTTMRGARGPAEAQRGGPVTPEVDEQEQSTV